MALLGGKDVREVPEETVVSGFRRSTTEMEVEGDQAAMAYWAATVEREARAGYLLLVGDRERMGGLVSMAEDTPRYIAVCRLCALIVVVSTLTSGSAQAESGVWSATNITAQVNVACTRVYTCGPAESVMYGSDKKLVSTSSQIVWGVCTTGSGPADSCNACLTNAPVSRCEWHLENK